MLVLDAAATASALDYPALIAGLSDLFAAGVDRVMLDEFAPEDLRRAVAHVAGRVALEVSGSVSLDRVRAIADTGIDFISVGALTKHVRAIDLSMRVRMEAHAA